jgi:hypothetical protein
MPKRISTNWFKIKSDQQTATNVSRLPVIARTGPTPDTASRENREQDQEGNSFFVVGKSEIGGEEII